MMQLKLKCAFSKRQIITIWCLEDKEYTFNPTNHFLSLHECR